MLTMLTLRYDIKSIFSLIPIAIRHGIRVDGNDLIDIHISEIAMRHRELKTKLKNVDKTKMDAAFNRFNKAMKDVSANRENMYTTGSFQKMYDKFEVYMFELNKLVNGDNRDRFELIHNEDCSICMDKIERDDIACSNGHVFHDYCIIEWLNSRPMGHRTCPMCRTRM
jgi:hypothetical protein